MFNGASLSISAALAHTVSHEVTPASSLLLFATAAIVYQVVNTVSVATILSLLSGAPLRTMWRTIHFWSFPWSLVSGGVAAVWAQIDLPIGFSAAVLCGVTLYLMSAFCEEMVARTMRSSETQNSPALTARTGRPVAEN